jgi:hypothetical protein
MASHHGGPAQAQNVSWRNFSAAPARCTGMVRNRAWQIAVGVFIVIAIVLELTNHHIGTTIPPGNPVNNVPNISSHHQNAPDDEPAPAEHMGVGAR